MEFRWINLFGAIIVILMLIPNILYGIQNRGEKNYCSNRFMNLMEQVGRYACIVLMWLPLLVWKFSFASVLEMLRYLGCNGMLLSVYYLVFALYMKHRTMRRALTLAILPAAIFLLSGVLLRHWLLVGFALLFAAGHIYVTFQNAVYIQKRGG